MKLTKIEMKNFFRFGNNEQSLDLSGSGLVSIQAKNGAGKTSIIEAILFALYGKTRAASIDMIVNRYTKKNCKVSLTLEDGENEYKIIRYRNHDLNKNNVYLFKNNNDISGHTVSETNNFILELIKIPYIGFINSTVFSSENYSGFLKSKNSDRLVIFENLLSLKEVTLFYTEAKKIIKELNEKLTEEKIKETSIKSEINTINSTIETYSNNAKTKLLELKSNKDRLKKEIEELNKLIENYSSIDIELEKKNISNNYIKEELTNRINKLESDKSSFLIIEPAEEIRIVNEYKDINFEENRIKELKYKEDLETIKNRENGYNISNEKIKSLSQEQSSLEKEFAINNSKIVELTTRIDKLKSSVCPFCGQHLNSEQSLVELENANKQIKELSEKNKEISEKKEEVDRQIEEERENYNWLLGDYNRLKEKLDKNFIPNSDLIEEKYNNAVNKIKEIAEVKKANSIKIEEINLEINNLKTKLENLIISKFTEEELNNISNKINQINSDISAKEIELAGIDGIVKTIYDKKYVESLKENISVKEKDLISVSEILNDLSNKIKHYEFLTECFGNGSSGFKKYFIGEMIELFNEKINQYLPFLFDEKFEIKFDKDLIDTLTMDDMEIDYSTLSQGQRKRAELAISFALFDVARVYFKNDNKLLFLDELDDGLDSFGVKAMINILKGFDKQLKIFVISHNQVTAEEITDVIKISKDENGFSLIK